MASGDNNENDSRLPLRHWLERKISSGEYKGLGWELTTDGSIQFRLPWVKLDSPGFEEYYKIFWAWAERGNNSDSSKRCNSTVKANFRSALNKSVDFEEVVEKSEMDLQTGTYKVFRILSPEEVRRKRLAYKSGILSKNPKGDIASLANNIDTGELKTIEKDFKEVQMMDVTSGIQTYQIGSEQVEEDHQVQPNEIQFARLHIQQPKYDPVSVTTPCNTEQPCTSEQHMVTNGPTMMEQGATENCFNLSGALKALHQSGIHEDDLSKFELTIKYNGVLVHRETLEKMEQGYRILYGDAQRQLELAHMKYKGEELFDYQCRAIVLPADTNKDGKINKILEKTGTGIVLQYNPTTWKLHAKRLSQSHIYFYEPHNHGTHAEPTKMQHKEVVQLFSYINYFKAISNNFPPHTKILLSVAIKPKSFDDMERTKGIQITLIPNLVKIFTQNGECDSHTSVLFSNPSSMDNLMKFVNACDHRNDHP